MSSTRRISDQVCQWLTENLWFSPDTLVSSNNKTDIKEWLKYLLNIHFTYSLQIACTCIFVMSNLLPVLAQTFLISLWNLDIVEHLVQNICMKFLPLNIQKATSQSMKHENLYLRKNGYLGMKGKLHLYEEQITQSSSYISLYNTPLILWIAFFLNP